jgi:hypothetical protein
MSKLTPEEVSAALMNTVNGYDSTLAEALHDAIIHEHRYLQGAIIGVLTRVLYRIGKVNTGTDARNEHAIKLCETLRRIADTGEATKADIEVIGRWFI